jgi:hypothetical protein
MRLNSGSKEFLMTTTNRTGCMIIALVAGDCPYGAACGYYPYPPCD